MQFSRRLAMQLALGSTIPGWMAASTALANQQPLRYPSKPLRIIVPYPAGGGADIIGRAIAAGLNQSFGVAAIVENKPGASGTLGNDLVAKSAPDGHTLLLGITAMIQAPALYPKLPYDVMKDLAPLSQLALSADLFIVPGNSPARTLSEFIALAKAQPSHFQCGNYGSGTSSHLHGELLKLKTGLDLTSVPYKGAAPLLNDLLGAQLSSAFLDVSSANAHLGSKRLRVLAITGQQRHPALPQVPTFTESGYPGFEANGWFGTFVPSATPQPIVDKLSTEIRRIVASPELSTRMRSMGLLPLGGTPQELKAAMERDLPHWARIVEQAHIRLD